MMVALGKFSGQHCLGSGRGFPGTHSGLCLDPSHSQSPTRLSTPMLTYGTLVSKKELGGRVAQPAVPDTLLGDSAPICLDRSPNPSHRLTCWSLWSLVQGAGVQRQVPATGTTPPATSLPPSRT